MNRCQSHCELIKRMVTSRLVEPLIPHIYQQVEYIESSGTQYIELLYSTHGKDTVNIYIDCTLPSYSGSRAGYAVFGGWDDSRSDGSNSGALFVWKSNNYVGFMYMNSRPAFRHTQSLNARYVTIVNIDNKAITYNSVNQDTGQTYSKTATASGVSPPEGNALLFAERNFEIDAVDYWASVKVYRFTVDFGDDGPCRDMIPCYRKSDNKPGMYDLVTKTFFTNAGTGEFSVGPNV